MTDAAFIEPVSLASLEGRSLFYPSAGFDWSEFLTTFADHIDEFRFADTQYQFDRNFGSPFVDPSEYRKIASDLDGNPTAQTETRKDASADAYDFVKPAHLTEVYERILDGRRLKVIRRRGYGQYALAEFSDRSIGVFVHRGDSPGEGGSNVVFLGNQKRRHEPLSNLFDKLTQKLADRALIISDGSNARAKFLAKFHNTDVSGAEAFAVQRETLFSFGAFEWKCVGYANRRYGPTLVWEVKRHSA